MKEEHILKYRNFESIVDIDPIGYHRTKKIKDFTLKELVKKLYDLNEPIYKSGAGYFITINILNEILYRIKINLDN